MVVRTVVVLAAIFRQDFSGKNDVFATSQKKKIFTLLHERILQLLGIESLVLQNFDAAMQHFKMVAAGAIRSRQLQQEARARNEQAAFLA